MAASPSRDALSVSRLLRPEPRRQRHPRSSDRRSGAAPIVDRSRRPARFRSARAEIRRDGGAGDAAAEEGRRKRRRALAGVGQGQGRPCRRAARADRGELRGRGRAMKLAGLGDIRFGASPLLRAVADRAPDRCRQVARQGQRGRRRRQRRRAGADAVGAARRDGGDAARADQDADRGQHRADHAGRTSAAESIARPAWRRRVLGDRPAGYACARHDPGFLHRQPEIIGARPTSPARSTSIAPIPMRCWPGCRAATTWSAARKSRCADRRREHDRGAHRHRCARTPRSMAARSRAGSRCRHRARPGATRLEAELKAERLDLDAAGAFIRSLAGPDADWPDEAAALARNRPRRFCRAGAQAVLCEIRLQPEDV